MYNFKNCFHEMIDQDYIHSPENSIKADNTLNFCDIRILKELSC